MPFKVGYPVSELSRVYKDKVEKKLMEGGQQLPFSNAMCTTAIKKCIEGIFFYKYV